MPVGQINCEQCGSVVSGAAQFCTQCGARVAGISKCPSCHQDAPRGAKFCVICGESLMEDQKVMAGNQWARRPGEFAARIETSDLSSVLNRGVAVQEGTRGMLFQHGRLVGILEPGLHQLETVVERIKSLVVTDPCTVILVDVGDVELSLRFAALRTTDHQEIDANLRIIVGLSEPAQFFANFMKGTPRVTTTELADRLNQQILGVMQSILNECASTEIYANRELVSRIEDEIRTELDRSFLRFGLEFLNVEFIGFGDTPLDELRQQRGELTIEQARLQVEQERTRLNQQFAAALTDERMRTIQTEQDFNEFVKQVEQEADIKQLLRRQEREELWQQYNERKDDQQRARQHLLATLAWQQKRELLGVQLDYQRSKLEAQHELSEKQREFRLQAIEREQQATIDAEEREHLAELRRLDAEWMQQRNRRKQESEDDIQILEKELEIAQRAQEFHRDLKHRSASREQELQLNRLQAEQKLRQAEEDARQQRKLQNLEAMSALSVEALIAAAPADRAEMLVELQKTESLKGMTEEQILACAAENSPEVAKAFAEKFKAAAGLQSAEKMEAMYERMLMQQERSADKATAAQNDNIKMFKELMETAFQTQRDTSVAAAQSAQRPPTSVVYPPPGSGAATVIGNTEPAAGPVNCPQCGTLTQSGVRFCGNCRFQFS